MNINFKNFFQTFFNKFVKPLSKDKNQQRREFILNIFLLSAIFLFLTSFLDAVFNYLTSENYDGMPLIIFLFCFLVFCFLLFLSRKGFARVSSYFFVAIFYIASTAAIYQWGADLPAGLLFYVLMIVISGILISTIFAFFASFLISITIFVVGYFQLKGTITPDLYWTQEALEMDNIFFYSLLFFIIATVSWLSNREIENSLRRARESEATLKIERDSLEIKVEERTQELKKIEMEKMSNMFRFAEIGRLSSGIFHDLANPLTAISLNIEKIKDSGIDIPKVSKDYLDNAVSAIKRVDDFISAARRQIIREGSQCNFSLSESLRQTIKIFSFRASENKIKIIFDNPEEFIFSGDQVKFSQIAGNLIANALDAYENFSTAIKREVVIDLKKEKDEIILSVKDFGCGVSEDNSGKIFQPFFTTKDFSHGTGIGLSLVKEMVEKDFGGRISFESEESKGSEFIVIIKNS